MEGREAGQGEVGQNEWLVQIPICFRQALLTWIIQ
jgi:hypothetical protein